MDNIFKNYVKEGQKLPMYGVGPYLIYGIAVQKAAFIITMCYVFKIGILEGMWPIIFRIVGGMLIILGFAIWFIGSLKSDMDASITENKLKTDGIYAWVRNPMYSGVWFLLVGVSFMWHNWTLVPLVLLDWIAMTVVLKNTEEKWLLDLYGEEYSEYKLRVNRCIPWKPKKDSKESSILRAIKRISEMEAILDKALVIMDNAEKKPQDLLNYQQEIKKLEDYYSSQDWKDDFDRDEKGILPADLKRGVLSEDGIYDVLERNKELLEKIK